MHGLCGHRVPCQHECAAHMVGAVVFASHVVMICAQVPSLCAAFELLVALVL